MLNRLIVSVALLLMTGHLTVVAAQPADRVYTSDLTTRWGRAVTPDNAWREYPRPQMQRSTWLNLNGQWDYAIRKASELRPDRMDGKILVPFAVEAKLSGVARRVLPDDRLWYRKNFAVPSAWTGQHVLLHFGAVDYEAHVWVNGALVGSHRGGSDTFQFDITQYLRVDGPNQLVIEVADPTSTGAQPRGKQTLEPGGIFYTAVTGIWQTVWLEPVPALHIEEMVATPDLDQGAVNVDVALSGAATDTEAVRLTASRDGRTVAMVIVRGNRRARLAIPNAHLWSPDDPYLYDLKAELITVHDPFSGKFVGERDAAEARRRLRHTSREADVFAKAAAIGAPLDVVTGYFAMRKISIGHGRVAGQPAMLLNNRAVFQNGTLDQGWWPDGLLTPPSDEAMRSDIEFLKKAGFNMLRKHIKVEPARFYYAADRLGMLVWQDMPSGASADEDQFVTSTSQMQALLPSAVRLGHRDELARMVDQLRPFPSIVTWVIDNEGWGQFDSLALAQMVKTMDPSRLVNADSGWLDQGDRASDLFDIHTYEETPLAPVTHAGRAIVIGEYGGIGLAHNGHLWRPGQRNWGYQTATDSTDFERRYRRKVDEIGRQKRELGLSAAVYTQTTDVEDEVNGFMTYDRAELKLPAELLARLNRQLTISP